MDWFRMYSEFASDPKVQSMSEAMQRRLTMLLCLRCSNTLVTLQDDEIAFALRISNEELAETKALFIRKGFIDETWEIMNWDKRQFVSDSSATRVARHRAKKKEEEIQACNVTETPQNRTDTEQIQNRAEKKKPVATPPALPDWLPADAWDGFVAMRKAIKKPMAVDAYPIAIRKLESLRAAGNDPRMVLEQSTMNSWQGLFEVKADAKARASPPPGYQTPSEKAKTWADRLTGRTNNETRAIIDITPAEPLKLG